MLKMLRILSVTVHTKNTIDVKFSKKEVYSSEEA